MKSRIQKLRKHFAQSCRIVGAAELIESGVSVSEIRSWTAQGVLHRVRHGYYCLAENEFDVSDESLIQRLIPQAIVCVESAAFHYGYSDFVPRRWSIAVPRTISRARLAVNNLPIRAYYVSEAIFELGKTTSDFNGVSLPVYDRERTICDVFKHRTHLDSEFFAKAVRAYANDQTKNINRLLQYAKTLNVEKKIIDLMGVLINE